MGQKLDKTLMLKRFWINGVLHKILNIIGVSVLNTRKIFSRKKKKIQILVRTSFFFSLNIH